MSAPVRRLVRVAADMETAHHDRLAALCDRHGVSLGAVVAAAIQAAGARRRALAGAVRPGRRAAHDAPGGYTRGWSAPRGRARSKRGLAEQRQYWGATDDKLQALLKSVSP